MKPEDFVLLANLVKQRSGLVLTNDKMYLLESRLPPVARKWGLQSVEELANAVRAQRDEAMMQAITEAMMTCETSFFRDRYPFEQFRKLLLPYFIKIRTARRQIRVWSAACSSGQEAYSLAMLCAEEATALQGTQMEILGTDLSTEMIERAKNAAYTQFEVQRGLPITMLVKYFLQNGEKWQIKDHLRGMVQFQNGNLIHDFGPMGVFDVIFCRNVLIYFDPPTRARVLARLAGILAPDGALFLGGPETVLGISDKFKLMDQQRGLYILANAPALKAAG